jgi:hypothetical protein
MARKNFEKVTRYGSEMRWRGGLAWLALCLALWYIGLCLPAQAQQAKFITFDAPGAGTGPSQGTYPVAVNREGVITGVFIDVNSEWRGFVRAPDGAITPFDVPGSDFVTAAPSGITPQGVIAGTYFDTNFVPRGFLRAPDGTITTFDLPGRGPLQLPSLQPINPAGVIAGSYLDATVTLWHGFVRAPDGTFTAFDAPGVGAPNVNWFPGTFPAAINRQGIVSGCFSDANSVYQGFVRAPGGAISTFRVPGEGTQEGQGISCAFALVFTGSVLAMNSAGVVTGAYFDANFTGHGFLRTPWGSITRFNVPGALATIPTSINAWGAVAGTYSIAAGPVDRGFVRSPDGNFTTFDVPGAATVANEGGTPAGTLPVAISDGGQVTGYYFDASAVSHGFIWIPPRQGR